MTLKVIELFSTSIASTTCLDVRLLPYLILYMPKNNEKNSYFVKILGKITLDNKLYLSIYHQTKRTHTLYFIHKKMLSNLVSLRVKRRYAFIILHQHKKKKRVSICEFFQCPTKTTKLSF